MASFRLEINAAVVAQAVKEAEAGIEGTKDYVDPSQRGLVLRIRGKTVTWLIKTRETTKTLGRPPKVGIREARRLAVEALAAKPASKEPEPDPVEVVGWTWPQLRDAYLTHISGARFRGGRVKSASYETIKDSARALKRPQFERWERLRVVDLTAKELTATLRCVEDEISFRQYQKALAYTKAALSYGYSQHPHDSGLGDLNPWWSGLKPREPSGEAVERIKERQRPRANDALTVEHLGIVLERHETFCAGRIGRDRIGPGIRWGIWWEFLTVARSGAGIRLLRENVDFNHPHVPDGWAMVWWSHEQMKTPRDFYLPIPPMGVQILKEAMSEWRELVNQSHGHANRTKWVFSSTRRVGRDHSNGDPCTAPSALNCHLENMRGKRQTGGLNLLQDIPHLSPHTLRGVAATYVMNHQSLIDGAASALLGHTLPGDKDPQLDQISKTTDAFYSRAQRIPLKIQAIRAWSEALLDAYYAAGGSHIFNRS